MKLSYKGHFTSEKVQDDISLDLEVKDLVALAKAYDIPVKELIHGMLKLKKEVEKTDE